MQLGAKLSFDKADKFSNSAGFDYFELFINPKVKGEKRAWENWKVIHAEKEDLVKKEGVACGKDAIDLAAKLGSKFVIIHSGVFHKKETKTLAENISSLVEYAKKQGIEVLLENLYHLDNKHYASDPDELKHLINETGCGFVLDFSHATYFANQTNRTLCNLLHEFVKLKPKMYHLSDGFRTDKEDKHLTLGNGDLDIKYFLKIIKDGMCTLEINPPTPVNYLRSMEYIINSGIKIQ